MSEIILTLIYKDFKGTESSLSYHTYDVGQNATASVSDYLGNLVINQKLYEGTGSRNPNGTCRIRQYYSNRRLWQYNNERTRTDYQNRKKNIFSGFGNYRTGYH